MTQVSIARQAAHGVAWNMGLCLSTRLVRGRRAGDGHLRRARRRASLLSMTTIGAGSSGAGGRICDIRVPRGATSPYRIK
jgi:hypothetical protein